ARSQRPATRGLRPRPLFLRSRPRPTSSPSASIPFDQPDRPTLQPVSFGITSSCSSFPEELSSPAMASPAPGGGALLPAEGPVSPLPPVPVAGAGVVGVVVAKAKAPISEALVAARGTAVLTASMRWSGGAKRGAASGDGKGCFGTLAKTAEPPASRSLSCVGRTSSGLELRKPGSSPWRVPIQAEGTPVAPWLIQLPEPAIATPFTHFASVSLRTMPTPLGL